MWTKGDKKILKIALVLVILCFGLSVLGRLFFKEEEHFVFEKLPFYEGLLGLLGAFFLTLVVKLVGRLVSRPEDDYDKHYTS